MVPFFALKEKYKDGIIKITNGVVVMMDEDKAHVTLKTIGHSELLSKDLLRGVITNRFITIKQTIKSYILFRPRDYKGVIISQLIMLSPETDK